MRCYLHNVTLLIISAIVQSVSTVDKSEPMIIKLQVIQSKTMHQPDILRHLQFGSISDDCWVLLSFCYMSSNIITMVIIICLWPFFIQFAVVFLLHFLSFSLSLPQTRSQTLSHSLTVSNTLSDSPSLSLFRSHSHSQSLSLVYPLHYFSQSCIFLNDS